MTNPAILTNRSAHPVWTCTVDVQQRTDFPVFARAEMVFTDDSTPAREHKYIEDRVVDPSPAAIAKLCRDQHAQLLRMDALALAPVSGSVDLAPEVVDVPVVDAATVARAQAMADYGALLRQRIAHKNAIDLGFLDPADGEVLSVLDQLQKAAADPTQRDAVLSLFG